MFGENLRRRFFCERTSPDSLFCPYQSEFVRCLIKKSGLFVFDAEFAVDSSEDTLYLSESEHTTK